MVPTPNERTRGAESAPGEIDPYLPFLRGLTEGVIVQINRVTDARGTGELIVAQNSSNPGEPEDLEVYLTTGSADNPNWEYLLKTGPDGTPMICGLAGPDLFAEWDDPLAGDLISIEVVGVDG